MPEHPTTATDPLALEAQALHYAAGVLSPVEEAAFEARLADDQAARDALAEAVRLSAAALGQAPPAPDRSFRGLIRERLQPFRNHWFGWMARRAYRGHPLAWAGLGAGVIAAATVFALQLASNTGPVPAPLAQPQAVSHLTGSASSYPESSSESAPVATHLAASDSVDRHTVSHLVGGCTEICGPDEATLKAAEIWAELSTPAHVEKAWEDESRWRHRLRDWHTHHPVRPQTTVYDSPDP